MTRKLSDKHYVNNQEGISLLPLNEGIFNVNGCCRQLTQEQ